MATSPATPRAKASFNSATPATSRVATSQNIQASPHYATTRRHSLYGVEDRVIIDPGSRIWKVGFSGEGKPRDVFYPGGPNGLPLWKLDRARDPAAREEEDKLLEMRLQNCLRSVFHDSLLADPKARKVILVEHPLLPLYIKEIIARTLFDNHVPSVSFASSHLLSLFAVGRITGLVVDCGHLESVALPIFASRPLFPQIETTPLAGAMLTSHIRHLLLTYARYLPPPVSLIAPSSAQNKIQPTQVPESVLTDALIEEIKTRCCFVGDFFQISRETRSEEAPPEDEDPEPEIPPSSDISFPGSDLSHVESSQEDEEFSSEPQADRDKSAPYNDPLVLERLYKPKSSATDIQLRVLPPQGLSTGTGRGTLYIPGWIREYAPELLFSNDIDEVGLAELVLTTLLKVPRDLRKTMASSILISGGTAMLPGLIPRLQADILRILSEPPLLMKQQPKAHRPPPPQYDKYKALRPLLPYIAILNNPSPPPAKSERAAANAGKAPAFSPAALAWVGGSLAGALKTGGIEVPRERWDEAHPRVNPDESMDIDNNPASGSVLPDWTRTLLPAGAPPANIHHV